MLSTSPPSLPGRLRIGISGSPESTPRSGSDHAVVRCRELDIEALEMAWVHKVSITPKGAARVRAAAEAQRVQLSVHAPYYINLNSRDTDILASSIQRIVDAGRAAAWVGAPDVVLHLAFNHDDEAAVVFGRVRDGLRSAMDQLAAEGIAVTLRPEVMGRTSQFGDLDQILRLCQDVPGSAPCIDIAHLHARTGAYNTPAEFEDVWHSVADALGEAALHTTHIHISGIAYGPLGEKNHLAFADADIDYRSFLGVLHALDVQGSVIVESPAREDDVLLLKSAWAEVGGEAKPPSE